MPITILAKDIMKQNYKWVNEDDVLAKALPLFDDETDVLIVKDKHGKYSGVLTERTILRSGLDIEKTKVKRLKTYAPKIRKDTPVPECARLMIENDMLNLPVFEGNSLVGIVDDNKLLEAVAQTRFANQKVKNFMSDSIVVVGPDEKISRVLATFREFNISRMPVVNKGEIIGIITMHDIIEKLFLPKEDPSFGFIIDEKNSILDLPVENIMSMEVISCKEDAPVKEAINKMLEYDFNSIVVLNKAEKLAGMLTRKDLLEPISEETNKKTYPIIQISSKIEDLNREPIIKDIERFARKYESKLKNASFYAYITQHKEKLRDLRLIYCRLRVSADIGRFAVSAEGFGVENAVRNALLKLEKQIHKKESPRTRADRQQFMDYIEIETI